MSTTTLHLTRLKFAARGSEARDLLDLAPIVGVGVEVTMVRGLVFRQRYVTLTSNESNTKGMIFIGEMYRELVRCRRA
jgi:hypothetical protein